MTEAFGDFGIADADGFYAAVNKVHNGYIRTEADEIQYNLHVMLRFDLERALMSGDLQGVVNAFVISQRTMRNIRQNLFWAFGYNTLLIPVAAGVLYPVSGMLLSPVLAAGAMALSSVFVLTNALRLRWMKPVLLE